MERVVFLVNIEDSSAVRAKRQNSLTVSLEDFCFLFPGEVNEYNPNKIIPLLDDSIIEDENFRDRIPEDYYSSMNKERFKDAVSEALEQGIHILLYCKGEISKEKLFGWLEEIFQEKGSIEIFQNHVFDSDYDNPQDVVIFEPYFEEIVRAFAENDLQTVLKNRAQE